MGFGKAPQDSRRGSVHGIGGDLLLFPSSELFEVGAAAAETKLPVEPERAGVDGLVIVLADLIRIYGNASRAGERAEATQRLRVDPRGFPVPVSVERVESDLDPFAEADGFDVVDGDSVLQSETGNIGAQWQTAGRRQVPEMDHHSAAKADSDDRVWIAERGAVELAVADGHHFANEVHDALTVGRRKFGKARRRVRKFVRQ